MISKKENIIKVAHELLSKNGSSQFSMRKVALQASMSLGNLQYYYKTKTDLINGILENYIQIYKIELANYSKSCSKGRDGLENFISSVLLDTVQDDNKFFIALFSFTELKGMEIPLKQFYGELFNLLTDALAIILGVPSTSESLKMASSLLLPYFEGYWPVGNYTEINHEKMAKVLADTVMVLITDTV